MGCEAATERNACHRVINWRRPTTAWSPPHGNNIKADTVRTYLSAVRQVHPIRGMEFPAVSNSAVNAATKGRKNKDSIEYEYRL